MTAAATLDKPTEPETEPEPEKKSNEPRDYIVMTVGPTDVEPCFIVGRGAGVTNKQAIADVVDKLPVDEQDGTFVAIAVRSWRPMKRTTQTVTKASWG